MNDLISRQDVEEIINDVRDCISVEGYWAILERMRKLSSAEPRCIANIHLSQEQLDEAFEKVKLDILSVKPKAGKWLIAEKDKYLVHSVRCSVCGNCISWMANYCPYCGSHMTNGGEDD